MTAESVEWVRVHPVRTYEQVLTQIQDKILDGELRIGSRLPSERDLVEILGVSRSSVREALRSLETLGLIDSNGYSGRASGSVVSSRSSQALGKLLRLHVALADITVADLVDVRFQLEQTGVLVAAQSRSAPDINRLRELNEAMALTVADSRRARPTRLIFSRRYSQRFRQPTDCNTRENSVRRRRLQYSFLWTREMALGCRGYRRRARRYSDSNRFR